MNSTLGKILTVSGQSTGKKRCYNDSIELDESTYALIQSKPLFNKMVINQEKISTHKTPTLPIFYQKPKQITIITTSYLQRNITKEHNILSESIVFDIKTYICIKTAFFNCCVTTAQFQRHQKFPLITIYFWQMAPHS